jgi:hypothetical protein
MLVETDLSPKTITEYGARCDRLRSACARALDVDIERLAWTPFVAWLFDQKPRWSANTWNMYKSSVRYALSRACDDDQERRPRRPSNSRWRIGVESSPS